jgi:hypothetical protein
MPKKSSAARKHSVSANLSVFQLPKAKSALTLNIFAHKEKIGTIEIGRGSIYWWGKNKQNGKRLSWSRFAAEMDRIAYGG